MSARLLTGKEPAASVLEAVKGQVKSLDPLLTIVQVGNDPASTAYVEQKIKACNSIGMRNVHIHLQDETPFDDLHALIDKLNRDASVTGFIVQLPLPGALHEKENQLIEKIDPAKDIDGFTTTNTAALEKGDEDMPPPTPAGIIELLDFYEIPYAKKNVVIIGKGNVGGKLAIMLKNRKAHVEIYGRSTPWTDVKNQCKDADIIVCAVGSPKLVTKDMVKKGAVLIDVGITRDEKKLVGDIDIDGIDTIASAYTPVPGGVGPMTIAMLLKNVITAALLQKK